MPQRTGERKRSRTWVRPSLGFATVIGIGLVVAFAVGSFRGSFSSPAMVLVQTERAGLVMNPDARVKMRGVDVGKVASIVDHSDGTAELELAMDPSKLKLIPANVRVDIGSTTVFGAKFVQLIPPAVPDTARMREGQVLTADHVTVEVNTLFERLNSVLSSIQPEKLNQTFGAIATALHGRGQRFGEAIGDLDAYWRPSSRACRT